MKEALKLALEALKSVQDHRPNDETNAAITAINKALAQPAQVPVASITKEARGTLILHSGWDDLPNGTKFYTTPQQRERVLFPTMLRKMWSGGEVQAWLDENVNDEKNI